MTRVIIDIQHKKREFINYAGQKIRSIKDPTPISPPIDLGESGENAENGGAD